jgi:ABC-2 type transport system ATP-binding protein
VNPSAPPETVQNPPAEFLGVGKAFGEKAVLHDFSWTLPAGQISGLLGPNGAGKTTLFRLLMGILKPTTGSIRVAGLDSFEDRVEVKRKVGFLPDEPIFYSYLSGREVIEMSAAMHGLEPATAILSIMPLVERLGLLDSFGRFAEDYSRGMKKKLGLLLALVHEPTLLVLDEPTNGLDVESTRLFFELMTELAGRGITIVFSTHLLDQVERLCSHAAIIQAGRLVASGTIDAIRSGEKLEDVFVRLTSVPR